MLWRLQAQRLLVERGKDDAVIKALVKSVNEAKLLEARPG
jgi:hypothetical protein